jgi:hypothetical protein
MDLDTPQGMRQDKVDDLAVALAVDSIYAEENLVRRPCIFLIASLAFTACSKPAPAKHFDQLKLSYKKDGQSVQRQIPIVFALLDSTTITRTETDRSQHSYGVHWLCFANYDLSENPEKPNVNATKDVPPGEDLAPVKACITINDKEGTDAASPLQPATYFIGLTQQMPGRISAAGIFWDKGKLGSSAPFNLATMTGSLKLDSVSEDVVSGEVNLSDGDNSIAGTFNLKPKIVKEITPPMR